MSMPVNSETFDGMVEQNVEWLKSKGIDIDDKENWLYGGHIRKCLEMAKKYYREVDLPNRPESDWDC